MVLKKEFDRLKSQPRWCQVCLQGMCKHGGKCEIPPCDPASVDAIRVAARNARAAAAGKKNNR
eukprot:1671912-Lingulodinium_polyedra.AAC.1